jgi:pimeloyl-ACP methyl ester carboxylesterase
MENHMLALKKLNRAFGGDSFQNSTVGVISYDELPDDTELRPVQLVSEDKVLSRGIYVCRKGHNPKIGMHIMHPRSETFNYNVLPLVVAGFGVLVRAGRWPNNDLSTTHEHLLLDFAAGLRFLRDEIGCKTVIPFGNSGGTALCAFYQAQARTPVGSRLTHTPGGEPIDLNKYDLPPADAIIFLAAHIGQGETCGKLIDPAVVDENEPLATDPGLDLYDPRNGFRIPPQSSTYSPEFLARYRSAQRDRVHRLDEKAHSLIRQKREAKELVAKLGAGATLAQVRAAHLDRRMTIYRTTADPACVDLSIDPDDRAVYTLRTPRPDLENYSDNAFARTVTPHAWLSTWSALSSRARTVDNVAKWDDPFIYVHYTADAIARMSEARAIFDACPSKDKRFHLIRGHDHYGFELSVDGVRGPRSFEGAALIADWVLERFG